MAPTPITINVVPYQGKISLTNNLANAAATMTFVNNGYTILAVSTGAVTPTLTISSIAGDIPGTEDIVDVLVANKINLYGPFQPIWWNQAGNVNLSLTSATSVQVAAFSLTF